MTNLGNGEELQKKTIDWINQNVAPDVEKLNALIAQKTEEIYVGTKNFLIITLIGVFIGVLTNISAGYFMTGNIAFGLLFLVVPVLVSVYSFYVWRIYEIRDLQKNVARLFYEQGKLLKEKFERDFGVTGSEE